MKLRIGLIAAAFMLMVGFSASAATAATTFNPSAAPSGTHVQIGTPGCTTVNGTVTCASYELAGVGHTNATVTLKATYSATILCRNHGGQIVEAHSQTATTTSSATLTSSKNGRLTVPQLTSNPPSAEDLLKQASCPNPNWTAELQPGSIHLVSFTYTLTFEGYSSPYITITG